MPAPKISKSSVSNAVSALREQGFAPSTVKMYPDGSITIDIATAPTSQDVPAEDKFGPKKWGEGR